MWPAPQVREDANGTIVTYYFVNATIICAKYEGVGFNGLSQVHTFLALRSLALPAPSCTPTGHPESVCASLFVRV